MWILVLWKPDVWRFFPECFRNGKRTDEKVYSVTVTRLERREQHEQIDLVIGAGAAASTRSECHGGPSGAGVLEEGIGEVCSYQCAIFTQ